MIKHMIWLILVLLAPQVSSQDLPKRTIMDQLFPPDVVQVDGFIGRKLDASYEHRILDQDIEHLVAPFRNRTETRCWQSEFWGKWFTSAVLAYRYRPEAQLKQVLDKAVEGLVSTQTPDGYIGNYADDKHLESWDIWGRKYCMLGLLAYYELTKEDKVLKAVGKLADHLINELKGKNVLIVKMGNHRGMAASSVLEPICLLYFYTGNRKYLEFAEEIVRQWETEDGPRLISKANIDVSKRFPKPTGSWYGWEQGQKAYEMMSCYEGLLELYRLTGKNEYKAAAEKTWNNINETEINIVGSGSAMEAWFNGKEHQTLPIFHYQETCVTVTWIKLGQQLLRLTGEAKYADAIELAYYNALLGSMKPDGTDWAKYTPLSGQRLEGSGQCGMDLNCCTASGPRGLFTLPQATVMKENEGLRVNFYIPGTYSLQTPKKQKIDIVQKTDYPISGDIQLTVQVQKPEDMSIKVRIPQWSTESFLNVNGEPVKGLIPGEYLSIQRRWKKGDVIELKLEMRGKVVVSGKFPESLAVVRGPIVLSRDGRLPGPAIEAIVKPAADKEGYLKLEPVVGNDTGMWMTFKVPFIPESYKEGGSEPIPIVLCDYASAGNDTKGHPLFKVWLPQLVDPRSVGN